MLTILTQRVTTPTRKDDNKMPTWKEAAKNLNEEYDKVTEDVRETVNDLRKEFDRRTDEALEAVENLKDEFERRATEGRDQLDKSMNKGKKVVRDHPVLVIGATLAIGIVAGMLLRGQSKDKDKDVLYAPDR